MAMLSLSVSCIHLELSAKSPKEQALVLSMILFQRGRKMTELCATRMELDHAFVEFPQLLLGAGFRSFDTVVTLPIRLHIPDDRESRRGPLRVRCKNSKRRLAAKPSASITPVEVAAAVCKYRHDRWKFEWGKPQFTRLDVAIGSKAPFWRSVGHFRSTPMNRHHPSRLACLKRAMADIRALCDARL